PLELPDDADNQPDGAGNEALYVGELALGAGSWLELAGRGLYFRRDGAARRLYVGDFDLSGQVDTLDLGVLEAHWALGVSAGWTEGDTDGDGAIDAADYVMLKRRYGLGAAEVAAIPEPPGLLTLAGLVAAAGLLRGRRPLRRRPAR
ncbi:MAG: hypothetical protein J7M21_00065, partial [Planctomycetes bacterium]|nr:hypothetical protein [Planctomycetota bacterium]